ncbi:MAG TPA: metallophosphoesterase [Methylococcaceae bacterium]|nr:metallophosphoesterase [Methylococcaceae bacterium]
MRIQYFSDIHLEFCGLKIGQTDADLIVAAGDIGIGCMGLEWLKQIKKTVVYVAGNHEFYGREYFATIDALHVGARGSNVHFLERESFISGDVRFLGCTLWTELGGDENDQLEDLLRLVNDFKKIRYRRDVLNFRDYVLMHRESRRWLTNELEQPFDGKTVVITHHAPTPWSWHESPSSVKRFAYCNDLKEIFHNFEIAAWFHGHTHLVSDYRCSGARILCNPRGYHPAHLVADFDAVKTVEI